MGVGILGRKDGKEVFDVILMMKRRFVGRVF